MATRIVRAALALAFCVMSFSSEAAAAEPSAAQKAALKRALQMYGWALPVCAWPLRTDVRPFCFTVAQLIQRFPLHAQQIAETIQETSERRLESRGITSLAPEQIIEKLLRDGTPVGCVPVGRSRGPITLGRPSANKQAGDNRLRTLHTSCESYNPNLTVGRDVTFGLLVGAAPTAPTVSFNSEEQASYQGYVEECRAEQAADPSGKTASSSAAPLTDEEKKKQAEAAQAADTAKQLEQQAEDARKKAEAARKRAEELQVKAQDPNLPAVDRATAQAAADAAAVDAAVAQDAADRAADDAAMAQGDADRAQADADRQRDIDAINRDMVYEALDSVLGLFGRQGAAAQWALKGVKYYFDRERTHNRDCIQGEACSMTCEQRARARVVREQLEAAKARAKCNTTITPLPDDARCYDDPNGMFSPAQVSLAQAIEFACRQGEKIDRTCEDRAPDLFSNERFDPCHGPLVMCAPESAPPATGRASSVASARLRSSDNKSVALPRRFRGRVPGMWTNPERAVQ